MVVRNRRNLVRHVVAVTLVASGGAMLSAVPAAPASATGISTVATTRFTDVGEHTFTVPAGVRSMHVVAIGGRGGGGFAPGGLGARAETDLVVTPGSTLYVEVGGNGAPAVTKGGTYAAGGFNGGGPGGDYFSGQYAVGQGFPAVSGAGGGGASDIQTCPANQCEVPDTASLSLMVVAAGGGGAGADSAGGAGGTYNGGNAATTVAELGIGYGATKAHPGGNSEYGIVDVVDSIEGGEGDSYGGGGGGGGFYGGGGGPGGWYPPAELAGGGGGGSSAGPEGTAYSTTTDQPSVTISYSTGMRLSSGLNQWLFLDVAGQSLNLGARIVQEPALASASQIWTIVPVGALYEIVNTNSGMCIATDGMAGDALYQKNCVATYGGNLWQLPAAFLDGAPIINPGSGLYADVFGGSTSLGGFIDAWPYNGGYSNQLFYSTSA